MLHQNGTHTHAESFLPHCLDVTCGLGLTLLAVNMIDTEQTKIAGVDKWSMTSGCPLDRVQTADRVYLSGPGLVPPNDPPVFSG